MTRVGLGLPGQSVADVEATAMAAAQYDFDSFSVYGDLGDLTPYSVLHANAHKLQGSSIPAVGPMGVPVGLMHPEITAMNAIALHELLPNQAYVGLVRGAFLDGIGQSMASLSQLHDTIDHISTRFEERDIEPRIYLGGFGPKLLEMAGVKNVEGVKLGGSANPLLAERARQIIGNEDVNIVLGAVSIIDENREAARTLARSEVAKYIEVVGGFDPTLNDDESNSLEKFLASYRNGEHNAHLQISDDLLDKFALAGNADDAFRLLDALDGSADRFEFGTPHGLGERSDAIHYIGKAIVEEHHR